MRTTFTYKEQLDNVNIWVRSTFFGAVAVVLTASAMAQAGETRLAGIRLYDSGVDVVRKLGSPNEVLPINVQFAEVGGQGGGGNAGGGGSRGGFASPPGGGSANFAVPPLSLNQTGAPKGGGGGPVPVGAGGGGGGPRPTMGGGGMGGSTEVTFVRWVYRRGAGGSVNVVLNNHNKVVQIEAIGVSNGSVRTAKGATLGSSMATVMKLYQTPDSYEVGQNYFMIRFLQKHRVAFRLTRENERAPYRVTGIVVSAGKQ
jgi:hypothetical protein